MFETAELGRTLSNEEYERRVPELRTQLLRAQHDLARANFSVLVVVEGLEGAGKGDTINLLHAWMDVRHLRTNALAVPTQEEQLYPNYWRFWQHLPPRGRIALFAGSWYSPLPRVGERELDTRLARIRTFERTLTENGILVVKLWFHVSADAQRERFERLMRDKATRWRVTKQDWKQHHHYESILRAASRIVQETSTGEAPWTLIESMDARYRDATVAEHLAQRIRRRLDTPSLASSPPAPQPAATTTLLDQLDLGLRAEKASYETELSTLQGRLNRLSHKVAKRRRSVVLVFEGPDASGKGGTIRRITAALDARQYRVISIAAPTAEEGAYPYLWRFWRNVPRRGRFAIFDRSWYGRVLVERVEGFAGELEWRRAYKEINDFEAQLSEHGTSVHKYWLQVSGEEQLRRFQEREAKPWKRYKITEEDYRNRSKTPLYEVAANDMIALTSTERAPWTLIEAEDKRYGRLKVLRTLCDDLTARLERTE